MSDLINENNNFENNNLFSENNTKKIPGAINVLTILTFVSCGIGVLSSLYSLFTIQYTYENFTKSKEVIMDNNLSFLNNFYTSLEAFYKINIENKYIIFFITIAGLVLCFYGALQMRKCKKIGLPIYLIGEWLPVALMFVLFASIGWAIFGILVAIVPIVFTILYVKQKKYLVH